jgi:hypothetical protein
MRRALEETDRHYDSLTIKATKQASQALYDETNASSAGVAPCHER